MCCMLRHLTALRLVSLVLLMFAAYVPESPMFVDCAILTGWPTPLVFSGHVSKVTCSPILFSTPAGGDVG